MRFDQAMYAFLHGLPIRRAGWTVSPGFYIRLSELLGIVQVVNGDEVIETEHYRVSVEDMLSDDWVTGVWGMDGQPQWK